MEIRRQGIGVSPGIAIGPALVFESKAPKAPDHAIDDPDAEMARFDSAADKVRDDLTQLHKRTAAELGEPDAAIIHVHLMLLDDVEVRATVSERVHSEKRNVEAILAQLIHENVTTMKRVDDESMRERADDIKDVGDRVLRALLDQHRSTLRELDNPAVIVAENLNPSDAAHLDARNTLGLVMDRGSTTAHTAILARAIGIPAVMGLKDLSGQTENGRQTIVHGGTGEVILDPEPETLAHYKALQREHENATDTGDAASPPPACSTSDGHGIPLQANIANASEAEAAARAGAEGVGLFRTEFLFLGRDDMPDENEQYDAYAHLVQAFGDLPVTIRTIDLGGDKFTDSLAALREENPQLGWRAIRFCLARPDIFKTQLRAILRASALGNIQILFPMISGLDELRDAKEVLESVKAELSREGIPFAQDIPLGIMIEVPSAVLLGRELAAECDFFSIGTNDLIQYTLAVDRGNERVAHLYEPAHPAVLRMIQSAVAAAKEARIPCGMCGAMAGDTTFTKLLIGLGITSLSMPAVLRREVYRRASTMSLTDAQTFAARATQCEESQQVWTLLRDASVSVEHATV